jgi:hypothetical protein
MTYTATVDPSPIPELSNTEALEAFRWAEPRHHLASCPGALLTRQGPAQAHIDCPHGIVWDARDDNVLIVHR